MLKKCSHEGNALIKQECGGSISTREPRSCDILLATSKRSNAFSAGYRKLQISTISNTSKQNLTILLNLWRSFQLRSWIFPILNFAK